MFINNFILEIICEKKRKKIRRIWMEDLQIYCSSILRVRPRRVLGYCVYEHDILLSQK